MTMKLLLGPSGKLSGTDFIAVDPRRPLASPALDMSWLWHRGSLNSVGFLASLPAIGSTGPAFWDGSRWGASGALARSPDCLIVRVADIFIDAVIAWADSIFTSVLKPRRVSIMVLEGGVGGGIFSLLDGTAFDSFETVDFTGIRGSKKIPTLVGNELFRGGRVMVATVTPYRVMWIPTDFGTSNLSPDDYSTGRSRGSDPPTAGEDTYFDTGGPNPLDGWTVFSGEAADHVAKLSTAIARFSSFRHAFYQASTEAPHAAVGATDSSLIPDGAMTALLGGSPNLTRFVYDPLDTDALLDRIRDDAAAFFS